MDVKIGPFTKACNKFSDCANYGLLMNKAPNFEGDEICICFSSFWPFSPSFHIISSGHVKNRIHQFLLSVH